MHLLARTMYAPAALPLTALGASPIVGTFLQLWLNWYDITLPRLCIL